MNLRQYRRWRGGPRLNPYLAKGAAIAAGVLAAPFLVLGGAAIAIAGIMAPFAALTSVAGAFSIPMLPVIGIVQA